MQLPNISVRYDDLPIPDNVTCNYYTTNNATQHRLTFYYGYGYVPETLLINFVSWLVLLLLFTILRKRAWNYGRIALVQKNEQRWTQLFYGEVDSPSGSVLFNNHEVSDPTDVYIHADKGFCSWLAAIFRIKEDHILHKNGHDAVHYLCFQRHIIFYLIILCVVCLTVILPVNFQGNLVPKDAIFGRTTISNLDPKSPYLWIHVFCAFIFLPIAVYIMRRFSVTIKTNEPYNSHVSRTVMITHVPKESCTKNVIIQHFKEAYSPCEIQDVQFAYNISNLIALDNKKEAATEARLWCENMLKEKNERPLMYPFLCGCFACNSSGCKEVDAIDYYQREETKLATKVEQEKLVALRSPLGIAFVTFDSEDIADKVYKDHLTSCKCTNNPPTSSLSRELETFAWEVYRAPPPDDIYWENISSDTDHWYIRAITINTVLFLVLFFLTTPAIVANSFNVLHLLNKLENMNPLLSEFMPTLLIWLMAALLPVIVSYSDQFLYHWTRSAQNHSVMRKAFIFLLFMVIILPSLGLTSAKAFVEWTVDRSNSTKYRWFCVFLPDNGAFFVNYVITAALIGTALEIIRFPELFMYLMRKLCARSSAEQARVQKTILWEFPFGIQYGWMMLNFATTVIYSIPCPIIAPFGLLYMCMKHCVDRYNIYFAYGPSKINKQIHVTAINFVVSTIIILQIVILFFLFIRKGDAFSSTRDIVWVMLFICCVTSILYIGQIFFNLFKKLSPVTSYTDQSSSTVVSDVSGEARVNTRFRGDDGDNTSATSLPVQPASSAPGAKIFMAPVLQQDNFDDDHDHEVLYSVYPRRSYGTSGASSPITESSSVTGQDQNSSTAEIISYH